MRLPRPRDPEVSRAHRAMSRFAPSDYYASDYQKMERMYLPALFAELRPLQPQRILEIGPGWGTTAWWLTQRGHDVTVMDVVPLGTFLTADGVEAIGCSYVHHDIEAAPSPKDTDLGAFDTVVMTQVIHHLAWRPDRALRHVASLLAPEGRFVASVLDRVDYPDVDAAFGDDWHSVPEWGSGEQATAVVKCMYVQETFRDLLETVFGHVTVWKPKRSKVLFAGATRRNPGVP